MIAPNELHLSHTDNKAKPMINSISTIQTTIHNPVINKMNFMTEQIFSYKIVLFSVRSNDAMAQIAI